jgi:hypothetical protein
VQLPQGEEKRDHREESSEEKTRDDKRRANTVRWNLTMKPISDEGNKGPGIHATG